MVKNVYTRMISQGPTCLSCPKGVDESDTTFDNGLPGSSSRCLEGSEGL